MISIIFQAINNHHGEQCASVVSLQENSVPREILSVAFRTKQVNKLSSRRASGFVASTRNMAETSAGGRKGSAARHNCSANGTERFEWGDSEGSMDVGSEEENGGYLGNRWSEVRNSRGEKRKKRSDVEESDERSRDSIKCIVRFGEQLGVSKINPLKLTKIINRDIGNVEFAKVLSDGNLLVGCNNEEQANKALKVKEVGGIKVVSTNKVGTISKASGQKGIIFGVPLNISMEEFKGNVKGGKVVNAHRLKSVVEGVRKDTETVVIEFQGEGIPKRVMLGVMSYIVREFIPGPVRCFNCQRFGHVATRCREKCRCARCGGNHEYGKCEEGVKPKCCNCGEGHSAAFRGCEVLKREMVIQKRRVEEKITYAEAAKLVRDQNTKQSDQPGDAVRRNKDVSEDYMIIEKKKFVTFIAGVINGTAGIESKTQKIQVVVIAAIRHLGLVGLTWEEVRDELQIRSSQDTNG